MLLSVERDNAPQLGVLAWLRVWKLWVRGKVCPPAQEFGKRGGVFQILMPTAPTRIKLSPALPVITPTYLASEALMFRNPAFGIKLRPASAWMKLSSCFYCHYFRVFTRRALFG